MPTYTFACGLCGARHEVVMSITRYCAERPTPYHCGRLMVRVIDRAPALALASDHIYEGLRAPDGTDISTRAKHRRYMKDNNLTTVDDFTQTWAKQAKEREERMAGIDRERASDIKNAIDKLGG